MEDFGSVILFVVVIVLAALIGMNIRIARTNRLLRRIEAAIRERPGL